MLCITHPTGHNGSVVIQIWHVGIGYTEIGALNFLIFIASDLITIMPFDMLKGF